MNIALTTTFLFLVLGSTSIGCGSSSRKSSAAPNDGGRDAANADSAVEIPLSRCMSPVFSSLGAHGPIYTANVTLGGSQVFRMLADTGSSLMGVASSSCTDCTGVSPLYTPGTSAADLHQSGSVTYNGSGISGELFKDNAQAGMASTVPVTLLSIEKQGGFLTQNPLCNSFQGVLGLATPDPGENDYFAQLVAVDGTPNIFSVGLCDAGGSLWLGGYNPSATTGPPQFTPMNQSGFYTINLTGIEIGGTALSVPSTSYGAAIVDTGEPLLRLPGDAFQAATTAIAGSVNFQKLFGGASWFTSATSCAAVAMTSAELDSALPSLTLTFGSNPSISVQAAATSSYLQAQLGSSGTSWCPGLAPNGSASSGGGSGGSGGSNVDAGSVVGPVAIIGDSFLRSSVVIFDRQNQRMGFAPHTCP